MQEVVGVDVCTIRCRPSLETLEIADTVEVRVDFSGGAGSALQELGSFTPAANVALSNHDNVYEPPDPPQPPAGSVTEADADLWENDWDLYPCDYLIVVPNTGFLNREAGFMAYVSAFAALRASLSGFDVCILKLGTVANGNDGYLDPVAWNAQPYYDWDYSGWFNVDRRFEDASFMGIRNFVKGLWENGVANNCGTGHLEFLLLMGDARDDDPPEADPGRHDWLVPSPRPFGRYRDINQQIVEIPPAQEHKSSRSLDRVNQVWIEGSYGNGSDHWYACLDTDDPRTDPFEDIAVGRFPVGSVEEMEIVYTKMWNYCMQSEEDIAYRHTILGLAGRNVSSINSRRDNEIFFYRQAFTLWEAIGTRHYGHSYELYQNGDVPFDQHRQMYLADGGTNVSQGDTVYINERLREGVGILAYNGHGDVNDGLAFGYYRPQSIFLNNPQQVINPDKLHLILEHSCNNGWIDATDEEFVWARTFHDGCAEMCLVKSLSGAIGFVGGARTEYSGNHNMLTETFNAMFEQDGRLVSPSLMGWKNSANIDRVERETAFYLGDPALDIFLAGLTATTTDITSNTQWSGQKFLPTTIHVRSGALLEILPGSELTLGGDLIIEDDAILSIQGTSQNPVWIHGTGMNEIFLAEDGLAVFIDNTVIWDMKYGVRCDNNYLWTYESEIHDCYAGLRFENGAFADVSKTEIYDTKYGLIALDSDVNLEQNHIHHADRYGIITLRTSGVWKENLIENTLNNNYGTGVSLRSSSTPVLGGNTIRDNVKYGVEIQGAGTFPDFNFWVCNGNNIYDNQGVSQVYVGNGSFDLDNSHNNIMSPDDEGFLIYDVGGPTHFVRYNYFGDPLLVDGDRFFPAGYTWFPVDQAPTIYDPQMAAPPTLKDVLPRAVASIDSVADQLLQQGIAALCDSLYDEAAAAFETILHEHASSSAAPAAVSNLYTIYRLSETDCGSFDELLDNLLEDEPDKPLRDACERASVASLIRQRDFENALAVCENQLDLEDCGNLDSLDILVDMAEILFLSNEEGGGFGLDAVARYPQLVSHSREEFDDLLCMIFEGGIVLNSKTEQLVIPTEYFLSQSYPNPFNSTTRIQYGLPEASDVSLAIYDVAGREVFRLFDDLQVAGYHSVIWEGKNSNGIQVSSGIYFVRLETGTFFDVKKMTLVR